MIEFRECLIATLRDGVRRIAEKVRIESQLEIIGLPAKREIEIALNQLDSASLPLMRILDVVMAR